MTAAIESRQHQPRGARHSRSSAHARRYILDLAAIVNTSAEPAPGDTFTDSTGRAWTVTFPDIEHADAAQRLIADPEA